MNRQRRTSVEPALEEAIVRVMSSFGRTLISPAVRPTGREPRLEELFEAGTTRLFADTASFPELASVVARAGEVLCEITGNTMNQPLVGSVVDAALEEGDPLVWCRELESVSGELPAPLMRALLYALVCARIANDLQRGLAIDDQPWAASVQVHMDVLGDPWQTKLVARVLAQVIEGFVAKIPFTPEDPNCLLIARDLQREGIPVNITSTFSGRQVLAVALLADAAFTNIFLGRLDQGIERGLGEYVVHKAQTALTRERRAGRTRTRLIAASIRDAGSLSRLAGCDVMTVPVKVLEAYIDGRQPVSSPRSRPPFGGPSHGDTGRLHELDDGYVEFLRELGSSREFEDLDEPEDLREIFEDAGWGDCFFHREENQVGLEFDDKIPDFDDPRLRTIPVDTLFTMAANSDFRRHQESIDVKIAARIEAPGSRAR